MFSSSTLRAVLCAKKSVKNCWHICYLWQLVLWQLMGLSEQCWLTLKPPVLTYRKLDIYFYKVNNSWLPRVIFYLNTKCSSCRSNMKSNVYYGHKRMFQQLCYSNFRIEISEHTSKAETGAQRTIGDPKLSRLPIDRMPKINENCSRICANRSAIIFFSHCHMISSGWLIYY